MRVGGGGRSRVGEREPVSVSECVSEWEHVRVNKSECGS